MKELKQPITWENTVNSEYRITTGDENNFIGIVTDIRKGRNLPDIENDINLFSLMSIVFISSIDIEYKIYKRIKVKQILVNIIN